MPNSRHVYLGMPGRGTMTCAASGAFHRACRDMSQVWCQYQPGSLLACNFNQLWCGALNLSAQGIPVDYFAMLHDDVGAEAYWLDKLIDELEAKELDILGVAVPIKDSRGLTSLALHADGENWLPGGRLTMRDIYQLPETFTSDDIGEPLLLNTGCWVCKFDPSWASKVHFEINDRIVFNDAVGRYQAQTEPEDWFFSRLCHELGLKIGATRKISVVHTGEMQFTNEMPWGTAIFDSESRAISPVPGAFPGEIPGWLHAEEGVALANLAKGKRVLEIGSYCGRSTVCLARTAQHVTAVDYFDGRGTPNPCDTLEAFRKNIERYGLTDKVAVSLPHEQLPYAKYDLAFIDGDHGYESVVADIARAREVLTDDGLLLLHDYKHPSHPGVEKAVDELLAEGGELISIHETLAVVSPPALVPLEI